MSYRASFESGTTDEAGAGPNATNRDLDSGASEGWKRGPKPLSRAWLWPLYFGGLALFLWRREALPRLHYGAWMAGAVGVALFVTGMLLARSSRFSLPRRAVEIYIAAVCALLLLCTIILGLWYAQ
jgi:hypothetical protein